MELFHRGRQRTRWASFENPTAAPGVAAQENRGAKGHPCEAVMPGESKTLLDFQGAGVIRRIWITVSEQSATMLRGLKLEAWWDGATTPAVAAPLGDFFGVGLGRRTAFQCALFSNPEGRSFNAVVPMPFRQSARIVVTNETTETLKHLFYDINFEEEPALPTDTLYFHTHWRRERPTRMGHDFAILPRVQGVGRFLGCNIGVIADAAYEGAWWGEGEVKVYLDGDTNFPTLAGTGTEDYIGTGWGQGQYANQFQGCPVADAERRQWCFYRYHVPDPIRFQQECRITIQQIGGADRNIVTRLQRQGAPVQPVSFDTGARFTRLLDRDPVPTLDEPEFQAGWSNFYRQDDWSSTAYFYLDSPENHLPPLAPVHDRTTHLSDQLAA